MPIADVNGQKIHFEDTGGSGPVVIFSHGLLMDREMFAPQVAALRGRYRVITWDERGHGLTGDAREAFSYYDSANDLAALLTHLGIDRAVLAGMSQGGYLSLRAALTHPGLASGLVLIDTQARPEDPATLPVYQQMIATWAAQGLSDEMAATIEHIILGAGYADAPKWKAKWRKNSPANLQQIFSTLATRDDISGKIAAIKVPALVIHGDADAAIPLAHAQEMARALPRSQLHVVAGAGHAANLTHAAQVNPAIEAFLSEHAG
ncbi:MAG TPA: alpha/beta hydrolase [Nevskiaceae bacterium]|nr:alpha/beta hydrolase [Nevskiaceae bacterium]